MSPSQTTKPLRHRIAAALASLIAGRDFLATVTPTVDDGPGWRTTTVGTDYDRSAADQEQLYDDALLAWRKNPIAKRAIDITTDHVLGDGITLTSKIKPVQEFINAFLAHPENRIAFHYDQMSDELSRAGDLFAVLFRDPHSGMSYIRFMPKPEITKIETAKRDWSKELRYTQRTTKPGADPRRWYSPNHGSSKRANAVMLHFSINKPIGALLGESDLATVLPWLLRYSRMLEDRVRLHWASRVFLWFVKVPKNAVASKREQYRTPPPPGSIIVHDDKETWSLETPRLNGIDSAPDMEALRRLIYAGAGHPPHWFGEPGSNRAEVQAMTSPAERHLKRRQAHFANMLREIITVAYNRASAVNPDRYPALPTLPPHKIVEVRIADLSRRDQADLSTSAQQLAAAYKQLLEASPARSRTLHTLFTRLILKFAGEPQEEKTITTIIDEAFGSAESEPTTEELTTHVNGHSHKHSR